MCIRDSKIVERVGAFIILGLGLLVTYIVFQQHSFAEIIAWRPAPEDAMSVGTAVDVMAAFSLAWVLGIAEFTRYTRTTKSATVAPLIGATVSLVWFIFVGVVATIGVALVTGEFNPDNSDPSSLVSGMGLGWVALVLIIVASVTTNVVNLMAAGISVTNVTKKLKPLHSIWAITILSGVLMLIPLYMNSFLYTFMWFLGWVGMALSALLGILVADYFFVRKRTYDASSLEKVNGIYWYYKGVNLKAVAVWCLGVVAYLLMVDWPLLADNIGAVYPTVLITAVLYALVSLPDKRGAREK